MAEFLVEVYISRLDGGVLERSATSARRAAEALTREGIPIRYVRSIFVPEDETCFLLFDAESADAVQEAVRRAEIPFERISVAVTEPSR